MAQDVGHPVEGPPSGSARFDPATRRWWREGLDRPWIVDGDSPVTLHPTLSSEPAIAHLAQPVVVAHVGTTSLRVPWPLVWEARVGDRVIDRFRPGMRKALLGPVGSGRVLAAAMVQALADDQPPPEGHATLLVDLARDTPGTTTVRRVAFDERGLTLVRRASQWVAGRVVVRIFEGDHADATGAVLPRQEGDEVLRAADPTARLHDAPRLRWWVDGTRRSMEYTL